MLTDCEKVRQLKNKASDIGPKAELNLTNISSPRLLPSAVFLVFLIGQPGNDVTLAHMNRSLSIPVPPTNTVMHTWHVQFSVHPKEDCEQTYKIVFLHSMSLL